MHPRQLKTLLTVARLGNFTRAASEANLAQSSLSDQMQTLEAELGVQLFERSRQGAVLTPSGEVLKRYAEEILALNDEAKAAVHAAASLEEQVLTIGTLETIATEMLAPFLSRFQILHPDIGLTVKIAGSGELQRSLEDGSIDLALTFDRGIQDERFMTRLVSREPLALISSRTVSAVPPKDLNDLTLLPFIATESGCVYRRLFDSTFAEAGIASPRITTQADSIATIIRLVASGTGYGLVPSIALSKDLTRDDIAELPWPGGAPLASLIMLWRRRRIQPLALSLVLALANDDLRPVRLADDRLRRAG